MGINVKVGLWILGVIAIMFFVGMINVFYTSTVGKAQQNAETGVYYSSQAYVDGVAKDLSDLRQQYNKTSAADEKSAIKGIVFNRYANFDKRKLNDTDLQDFLTAMRQ